MLNYIEVTLSDICGMKYTPLTSIDVEYTLSRYELTLKSNHRTLKLEKSLNVHLIQLFRRRQQ
jgi:hypothetical protein